MDTLKEFNGKWKELFEKEKLRIVSKQTPFFVDFLKNSTVKRMEFDDPTDPWSDWELEVLYKGKLYEFVHRFEDNFFFQQENLFVNDREIDDFFVFLQKLEIRKYINKLKEENYEKIYDKKIENDLGTKILRIEKDPNSKYFFYVLENGVKLIINPWEGSF